MAEIPTRMPDDQGEDLLVELKRTKAILLVDDEEDAVREVEYFLKANGYTVIFAASGHEGVRQAASFKSQIGVVVTDIRMPGLNGIAMVNQLRDLLGGDVPVLYMTGADITVLQEAWKTEPVYYVQKPADPEQLLRGVERCYERLAAAVREQTLQTELERLRLKMHSLERERRQLAQITVEMVPTLVLAIDVAIAKVMGSEVDYHAWRILMKVYALEEQGEAARPKKVRTALDIAAATAQRRYGELMELGLITPATGERSPLVLTAKGRALVESSSAGIMKLFEAGRG